MKKLFTLLMCLVLVLPLCACQDASSQNAPVENVPEENAPAAPIEPAPVTIEAVEEPEPAAEEASEPTAEPTIEPEPLSPYNWLGYPEVPQCKYLDLVCSQHYYREYTTYVELGGSVVGAPSVEAVDDRNLYTKDMNDGRTYYVDGQRYSIREKTKTYQYNDWTNLYAITETAAEKAKANVNPGKKFQGTGKGSIPLYETVDPGEYEYYEYLSDASSDISMTERLYLKDGDVFALYSYVKLGEQITESTVVTTLITGDIPAGIFEIPDLSGYTEK